MHFVRGATRAEFLAMVRVEALKAAVEHTANSDAPNGLVLRKAEVFEEWILRGEN
jgi:hypothetical protein